MRQAGAKRLLEASINKKKNRVPLLNLDNLSKKKPTLQTSVEQHVSVQDSFIFAENQTDTGLKLDEKFKVYVGNLNFETPESRLELFTNTFRVVSHVHIPMDGNRRKGFGFLYFDSEDDAAFVIRRMNGAILDGRRIYLQKGKEKRISKAKKMRELLRLKKELLQVERELKESQRLKERNDTKKDAKSKKKSESKKRKAAPKKKSTAKKHKK